MSIRSKAAIVLLALLAASTLARSDGISVKRVGQNDGISASISAGGGGGGGGCSNSLIFTSSCNSQYIGAL